ncbi:hypothetical protein D3C87_1925410 [compost metagenome]
MLPDFQDVLNQILKRHPGDGFGVGRNLQIVGKLPGDSACIGRANPLHRRALQNSLLVKPFGLWIA